MYVVSKHSCLAQLKYIMKYASNLSKIETIIQLDNNESDIKSIFIFCIFEFSRQPFHGIDGRLLGMCILYLCYDWHAHSCTCNKITKGEINFYPRHFIIYSYEILYSENVIRWRLFNWIKNTHKLPKDIIVVHLSLVIFKTVCEGNFLFHLATLVTL